MGNVLRRMKNKKLLQIRSKIISFLSKLYNALLISIGVLMGLVVIYSFLLGLWLAIDSKWFYYYLALLISMPQLTWLFGNESYNESYQSILFGLLLFLGLLVIFYLGLLSL